jgi:hypothetical protein
LANSTASIDSNYQLNTLQNKNPSTGGLIQLSTNTTSSLVRPALNLNNTNSIYMYNPLKNNQNFYHTHHPRYDLTSASITYLPTSNTNNALFFPNSNASGSTLTNSGFVAPNSGYADLAFGSLGTVKALSQSFNGKIPYNATSICLNGLKKRKRRYKKPPELRKVLPKNSLMLLHEFRPNIEYRFLCQSGPIHRPLFTMCVDINEHKFEGTGKTKKEARMQAAERALEFLVQHPEYIQKPAPASSISAPTDLSSEKSNNDTSNNLENNTDDDDDDDDEDELPESNNSSTYLTNDTENVNENDENIAKRLKRNDDTISILKDELNV